MNRSDTKTLTIAGAVILSLLGFTGAATWLLQSAIITPEIKGLMFFGWLVSIAALFPHPLDDIALIAILGIIAIIGIGCFLFIGRIWYFVHGYMH